jgi:hypothetical protein
MPVIYNGKKIIPAPLVNIQKEYERTGDGNLIGSTFVLTLTGTLTSCKGSPTSSGTFWTLGGYPPDELLTHDEGLKSILHKQEALRLCFADEGKAFEIQPLDGSAPVKCYPVVDNLDFQEDIWVQKCDYNITLRTSELFGFPGAEDAAISNEFFVDADGNKLYLQDVSEDWALEFNDTPQDPTNPHSFRLTHTINAVGKKVYDDNGLVSPGWEQARRWVTPRLGLDNTFLIATSGLNLPAYFQGFNHVRSESTDELAGSYGVTETWIISSGNFLEDFTVTKNSSSSEGKDRITIEGTITGLETRNNNFAITQTKWQAAKNKFDALTAANDFYNRAVLYSQEPLRTQVVTNVIGRNPNTGVINYSYEYDNGPENCVDGALNEVFTITNINPTDVFAIIPVMGRSGGPVLQDMGTVTERKVQVSYEGTFAPASGCAAGTIIGASPVSEVDAFITSLKASLTGGFDQVFTSQDTDSWNPKDGRYTRNVEFTMGSC